MIVHTIKNVILPYFYNSKYYQKYLLLPWFSVLVFVMHTRKSAPLPSPSSAQNPYEINYAEHYPRLHQYIMDKIEQ